MKSPVISVIVPTFNRADLLKIALESVISQNCEAIEIIVADNDSQDHTRDVVKKFEHDPRLVYVRNDKNIGMVRNWKNAIYKIARGEWFILLSDDDYLTDPSYLQTCVDVIEKYNPKFIYSGGSVYDTSTRTNSEVRIPFSGLIAGREVFATRGTIEPQDVLLPTMVFRIADAERLGFLSDPDNLSCDSELYLKLCAEGDVYAIKSPACTYLKHGENLTYKVKRYRRLLDSNLDHLIKPLAHAHACGMDQGHIDRFIENTRVIRLTATTLIRLRAHSELWYRTCRQRVHQHVPALLDQVEQTLLYRIGMFVASNFGSAVRRRYPLADSEPGTL